VEDVTKNLAALVVLAAVMVNSGIRASATPVDFAFKFDFTPCLTSTLDTYANVYTREIHPGETPISITLTLSSAQMDAVYQGIVSIDFFHYPARFSGGALTPTGEMATVSPSTKYRLEVRAAGQTHTVFWDDNHFPHSEAATRLLKLFEMINGFLNDRAEVTGLPGAKVYCM
jgi:hypothetical protein